MKRTLGVFAVGVLLAGTTAAFGQQDASSVPAEGGALGASSRPDTVYSVISSPTLGPSDSAYSQALKQGIADFQAGRLTLAETELQGVLVKAPNNVTAHSLLGYIYLKQNRSADAAQEMQTVVRLAPRDPGAHKNLGRAYLQSGQNDKAAEEFRTVLAASPRDADAQFGLGVALGQTGQYADSAAAFQNALDSKPTSTTYQDLGVVLQKAGRNAQAADAFSQAATLDPKNGSAWLSAGLLYAQAGNNDKAIPALQQAIALGAGDKFEAHTALAQAYAARGDNAQALKEFTAASALQPNDPHSLFNRAVLAQQAGQTADAEQAYRNILNIQPGDPAIRSQAQSNLGLLLANDGQADEALPLLTAAAQADPKSALPHAALGTLYAKQGDMAKAIAERRLALSLDPSDTQTRLLLADSLLAEKKYGDAAQHYQTVARADPRNTPVQNALGTAYAQAGATSAALAAFRAALAGSGTPKEKALVQNNLGWVYERQHKQAQAIAAYKRAVALDPSLPEARQNLSRFTTR